MDFGNFQALALLGLPAVTVMVVWKFGRLKPGLWSFIFGLMAAALLTAVGAVIGAHNGTCDDDLVKLSLS